MNIIITNTAYYQVYIYFFTTRLINRKLFLEMYSPWKSNEAICQEKTFMSQNT